MNRQVNTRISPADLESLISTLQVNFVQLSERAIIPDRGLELAIADTPSFQYTLAGTGHLIVDGLPSLELRPHNFLIAPSNRHLYIEASADPNSSSVPVASKNFPQNLHEGAVHRFIVGEKEPQLFTICGYFRATYGTAIDIFTLLSTPIIEQFEAVDKLDHKLKAILRETAEQGVGIGAMTTESFKQVLIALLRRALVSVNPWVERFSIFSDPKVAHAFASMAVRPGAAHSLNSLAKKAGLSRSAFMVRFNGCFGKAPMTVLRELRMHQAGLLMRSGSLSIDKVAQNVGYASRSSFLRAFRKVHGQDPSNYRKFRSYNAHLLESRSWGGEAL